MPRVNADVWLLSSSHFIWGYLIKFFHNSKAHDFHSKTWLTPKFLDHYLCLDQGMHQLIFFCVFVLTYSFEKTQINPKIKSFLPFTTLASPQNFTAINLLHNILSNVSHRQTCKQTNNQRCRNHMKTCRDS